MVDQIAIFNPQAPVAQKVADEVVFRRFRGEGVEFFKIGPHWPENYHWPDNAGLANCCNIIQRNRLF